MKIALMTDSLLLDRSLEMYLKDYLTSYKQCDFIVTTKPMEAQKPVFLISHDKGAHLQKPFTKAMLLEALEHFYLQECSTNPPTPTPSSAISSHNPPPKERFQNQSQNTLQQEIQALFERHQKELQQEIQALFERYK